MKIDQETLAVLNRCTVSPLVVMLPPGQLDRKLYEKVNKVLIAAGGKWNRSTKAHVFTEDAAGVIEQALLTGEIGNPKQELGVFYTPDRLAFRAAEALQIEPGQMTVLEPSAGVGALAKAARGFGSAPICWDILEKHVNELRADGFTAAQGDFLKFEPKGPLFDRIIMNPPFGKTADALHFLHAVRFLKPGGRIVAIMSAAVMFRATHGYRTIRDMVALADGSIEPLPANSFKESGTSVNAALVVYDKPMEG